MGIDDESFDMNIYSIKSAGFPLFVLLCLFWTAILYGSAAISADSANICKDCNIILITIDTLRADHLGFCGYPKKTSPHLDGLSKSCILFENAYTPWPRTSPAVAALMTGNYGHTNGVMRDNKQRIADSNVMLAELLKREGYYTGAAVSNGNLYSDFGFDQGMEDYLEKWDLRGDLTRAAVNWLETHHKKKFFFWVHYVKPHAKYTPDPPFDDVFTGKDRNTGKVVALPEETGISNGLGAVYPAAVLQDKKDFDFYISQYDGEIAHVDHELGTLLKKIRELGLFKRSIMIVTSDHGESLGEHNYYFDHGLLPYDACSRVPFMIRFPGIKHGISNIPVSLMDIIPTIRHTAGLSFSQSEFAGKSLLRLLKDGNAERYIFTESGYAQDYELSVRSERWKLIRIRDPETASLMNDVSFELYDIIEDPGETENLAYKNLPVFKDMRQVLADWTDSWINVEPENAAEPMEKVRKETLDQLESLGYIQ